MWRHLTRGLQQGFKRSICFEEANTCVKDGKNSAYHPNNCITELLPSAVQNLNHYISQQGHGDQRDYHEKTSRNISQNTFLEACGWSGALVFGWVISQQLWLKRRWTQVQDVSVHNKRIIQPLTQIVQTQPLVACVLPQSSSTVKPTKDVESKLSSDLDDEFEAAAKELQDIHEKAIGKALNRRGIACLSMSTGSAAIAFFKRASDFKYPPASFNMGQCCELGIGTEQDFKQAAEWYKIASDQGHATAMYNLGVFYAHGWGGLRADIDTAKNLFVNAAKLGQPDAKAALDKESKSTSDLLCKTNNSQIPFIRVSETKPAHFKSEELKFFVNKIRNGLPDDVFQRGFGPEKKWDVPLNSAVAF